MINRTLRLCIFIILLFLQHVVFSQHKISVDATATKTFFIVNKGSDYIKVNLALSELVLNKKTIQANDYTDIQIPGFGKSYNATYPDLPSYTQLLTVPFNVDLLIDDIEFNTELHSLSTMGFKEQIKPASHSISKNSNQKIELEKGEIYTIDDFFDLPIVSLREVGIMRDIKLYELVYNPILYNPVKNSIKIRKDVSFNIKWQNTAFDANTWQFIYNGVVNQANDKDDGNKTYVIVSPLTYKNTLQRFIKWKRQKGFEIIEAYIGDQLLTNSKNDIYAYLNSIYQSPPAGMDKPSYLLIVGDVDVVPTWNGATDSHVTDLYYAEYTNDYLPDLYYGRISVDNEEQLEAVIDKTLFVEKGLGQSYEYQNKHLLISGVDSDFAPLYGNGVLNYLLDNYSNDEFGISASYYLYGSGSPIVSNNYRARESILNDFSAGAGIALYTAHCDVTGWSDPSFSLSDISGISNKFKYPLMIGNCCESLKFNQNSFGENIVREKDKGAVAYIGATNYSYWDEDYFWGVGFTSNIVANPPYENTGIGAFDSWFHSHNENEESRSYSVGEILTMGNLAVQNSSSLLKKYYWEVYQIMGDPSLVPEKFKYHRITANYSPTINVGQEIFSIQTEPHAVITLMHDNEILGNGFANSSGYCNLEFTPVQSIGLKSIELVISKPDFLPLIDSLDALVPNGAFLAFKNVLINDSIEGNNNKQVDYGESVFLNINTENYGNEIARNAKVIVNTKSVWVTNGLNFELELGDVGFEDESSSDDDILVAFSNSIPDSEKVQFSGIVIFNDADSTFFKFEIEVNAPRIEVANWVINDTILGNGNGIIEIDEIASLNVSFINIGGAQVTNTTIEFVSSKTNKLSILDSELTNLIFEANETLVSKIKFKAGENIFSGEFVEITYKIKAGDNGQYQFSGVIPVTLGHYPSYNMADNNTEIVSGYFYDSGGEKGNYFDNETTTMTFRPHYENQGLMIEFLDFAVESAETDCYDKLYVYDGLNTQAPLIGVFCDNNYKSKIYSQNIDGALTFAFVSDASISDRGWKGLISSLDQHTVTFKVTDGIDCINDAEIEFGNQIKSTQKEGIASFENVLEKGNKQFNLNKTGYLALNEDIGDINGDTTITLLIQKLPDICFTVFDKTEPISGAQVYLGNNMLTTDENGNANFIDVTLGEIAFKIFAFGYFDTARVINVSSIDACYEVKLNKKPTYSLTFNIYSNNGVIEGAAVYINEEISYSNENGRAFFEALFGESYFYTITKSGYYDYAGSLTIPNKDIEESVNLITDISSVKNEALGFSIYPNPLHNNKELNIMSESIISELKIFNYEGRLLVTKNNLPKEFRLNLSDLSKGIYIFQVKFGDDLYFEKLMVE
ncbi:MAG: C25 family cysteine peptidase [Salinivirgaceae bacterium]|jgi:hypothetical protein|nr:C25 family cysteine peptidase [Salinivirgaceae bacterium]